MAAGSVTLVRMASLEGWQLAYEVVSREIARRGITLADFSASVGIHRTTLNRMSRGDELGQPSLAAIEGGLSLPRDFLRYIAEGDRDSIQSSYKADPDLVRWLLRRLDACEGIKP